MDSIQIRLEAEAHYREGIKYFDRGDFSEAIIRFLKCQKTLRSLPERELSVLFDYMFAGAASYYIWRALIAQANTTVWTISFNEFIHFHATNASNSFLKAFTGSIEEFHNVFGSPLTQAKVLNELAIFFCVHKNLHQSLHCLQAAVWLLRESSVYLLQTNENFQTEENLDFLIAALNNLARNYHELITLNQKHNDTWNERIIEKPEELINFYKKVVDKIKFPTKRRLFIFNFSNCFAYAFAFEKRWGDAIRHFNYALMTYPKIIKESDSTHIPEEVSAFLDRITSLSIYNLSGATLPSLDIRRRLSLFLETLIDIYFLPALKNYKPSYDTHGRDIGLKSHLTGETGFLREHWLAKRSLEDRRQMSLLFARIGDAYWEQHKNAQASSAHQQEIFLKEQLAHETGYAEEHRILATRLNQLGHLYTERRDISVNFFQQATYHQAIYLNATNRSEKTLENQRLLAIYYIDLSEVAENHLKKPILETAIALCRKILERAPTPDTYRMLAFLFNRLGNIYVTVYLLEKDSKIEALKVYGTAVSLIKNLKAMTLSDQRLLASCYNNRGKTYYKMLNQNGALNQFREAMQLSQLILDKTRTSQDRRTLQNYINNLAETYLYHARGETLTLGNYQRALALLNRAKAHCQKLIEQENKPEDRRSLVKILFNIGFAMQTFSANGKHTLRQAIQVFTTIPEKNKKDLHALRLIYNQLERACSDHPRGKELFVFAQKVFLKNKTTASEKEEAYPSDFYKIYQSITKNTTSSYLEDLLQFMQIIKSEHNNPHLLHTSFKEYFKLPKNLRDFTRSLEELEKLIKAKKAYQLQNPPNNISLAWKKPAKRTANTTTFFARKIARRHFNSATSESIRARWSQQRSNSMNR